MKKKLLTVLLIPLSLTVFSQVNYVPNVTVSTLAGSGTKGSANGIGTAASFSKLKGIAADTFNNVYVIDSNAIRKIKVSTGDVTLFAGSYQSGNINATGANARFKDPEDVAVDGFGNVYVADKGNYVIKKITPAGVVSTLAGSGVNGNADGIGTAASFDQFYALSIDLTHSFLYVTGTTKIRKVNLANGAVTTPTITNGGMSPFFPDGGKIAIDQTGLIYYGDNMSPVIHNITLANSDVLYAGNKTSWGNTDGKLSDARFAYLGGTVMDADKNLYIADGGNQKIRFISNTGVVSTMAGSGTAGKTNGAGSIATFENPRRIAVNFSNKEVFLVDDKNYTIRKIVAAIVTNVENETNSAPFSLFPNPVNDRLSVISASNILSYQIFDVLGREVANSSTLSKTIDLDMSSFIRGTYFIKLQTHEGTSVQTFIKD